MPRSSQAGPGGLDRATPHLPPSGARPRQWPPCPGRRTRRSRPDRRAERRVGAVAKRQARSPGRPRRSGSRAVAPSPAPLPVAPGAAMPSDHALGCPSLQPPSANPISGVKSPGSTAPLPMTKSARSRTIPGRSPISRHRGRASVMAATKLRPRRRNRSRPSGSPEPLRRSGLLRHDKRLSGDLPGAPGIQHVRRVPCGRCGCRAACGRGQSAADLPPALSGRRRH